MQRLRIVPDASHVRAHDATLRLHVFGVPRAAFGDVVLAVRGRPKLWPLIALLAVHHGESLPRERVAAWLWPECSDVDARSNLRRHLSYVEDVLPRRAEGTWLARSATHVGWDQDCDIWVDARAFVEASRGGDALHDAAALYAGEFLSGVDDDWANGQRERYRDTYAGVLERLVALERRRGEPQAALRYATDALRLDPFREDLVRTIMRLRFESGDRSGALREFARFESLVRTELDATPSEETIRFHVSIADDVPVVAAAPVLPAQHGRFIGRTRELERLDAAIATSAIVTIAGAPGVGKTALAVRFARGAAARFANGVRFVDLSSACDAESVLRAVTDACDDRRRQRDDVPVSLETLLTSKQLLLIFDNAEGVAAVCARLAERLTRFAPDVRVLVTSRIVLESPAESVLRLEPFAADDALRLFVERARTVLPTFGEESLEPDAARAIARATDGLPLALELAAARLRTLTLRELIARLARPLRLFGDEPVRLDRAAKTLRQSLLASYALLDAGEQQLFRRLSVFAGGATLAAVRHVCAGERDEWQTLEGLSTLIDHSLLVAPLPEASEQRYDMLVAIADFARERLERDDDAAAVRIAHARYFAELYAAQNDALRGARAHALFDAVARDHAQLRRALDVLLTEGVDCALGARLALALSRFWFDRGFTGEGAERLDEALRSDALPVPLRAQVAHVLATLIRNQGDYRRALGLFAEALALMRETGEPIAIGKALATYSNAARMVGEHALAQRLATEACETFAAIGDPYLAGYARMTSGCAAFSRGDVAAARAEFEASLALYRQADATADIALALGNLAACAYWTSDVIAARLFVDEAVDRARSVENMYYLANALLTRTRVALHDGERELAAASLREAFSLATAIDDKDAMLSCVENAVHLALETEPQRGTVLLAAVDRARERFNVPRSPVEQADADALANALARRLDAAAVAAARVTGLALALPDAVSRALRFLAAAD